MMRTLCHLILGLLTASAIQAQTLSLGDDTVKVNGYADAYEIIGYGTLYNNTSDAVEVTWLRVANDIPGEWLSQVCDNNICYPEGTNTPTLPGGIVTIPANGSSNFDVHFRASDIPGSGTVLMRAWVIGDSANTVVSGVYKATAQHPVSARDRISNNNLLIYPNPAKDYIMIKNLPLNEISTVEIYNIFGRKMLSFSQPPTSIGVAHKFDLTTLPKGVYMIRVFDKDMNVIHTMSLSKE
jgi:hypothetical protein